MVERKILLNPGPATTTDSVKNAQVVPDICHRVADFSNMMKSIREDLTRIATKSPEEYTCVLFAGSGTAAVEAAINSVAPHDKKTLIINNGAYGKRMVDMAKAYKIPFVEHKIKWDKIPEVKEIEKILKEDKEIACVAVVHHETTSGLLNPIQEIGKITKENNCVYIIDAMSSFAGIKFDLKENNIDFMISSSNKCIQGMSGVSFVVCNKSELEKIKDYSKRSVYFDLYKQYRSLEDKKQMQFTPPVQTLYALRKAIDEFFEEGAEQRQARYFRCWETLTEGLKNMGFKLLLSDEIQSRILTTIIEPENEKYDFEKLHDLLYDKGFTIYPGKVERPDTFRLANLGAIDYKDIEKFLEALKVSLIEMGINKLKY